MARSPIKVASENDVTPLAEETLDFDDDNLKGKGKRLGPGLLIINSTSLYLLQCCYVVTG